jgi:phosphoglycerate dehydrogenase-like enzyme
MLIWVPTAEVAAALDGLAGPGTPVDLEQVAPDGKALPASAAQVEFYVPPFFPGQPAIAAMRQMPRLSVVQALTAGVDRLLAELPDGVTLCNARGAHDASTAEWVVAAILAALREFPRFAMEQAAGRWSYQFTGCLAGQTVLIVGYGSIGAAVERRLAGFEVNVRRVARRGRDGGIPVSPVSQVGKLLPEADVVVVLAPVTTETLGMVDAGFLARMKDGALLVNAARGSLVATDALCDELSRGRLRAVLDVTDPEPLPPGHPLWALPGVFFTPHVAASTPVSTARALSLVRKQVERFINGQPLQNVISGAY